MIMTRQSVQRRRAFLLAPAALGVSAGLLMAAVTPGFASSKASVSGTLQAWGDDLRGQLGNGATGLVDKPVTVQLPAGVTITAVAAGGQATLAVTSAGQVYAWGDNQYGQLGDGTTTDSHTPVLVHLPKGTVATAVAAGDGDSLAVTSTGQVYAWGNNHYGELGDGSTVNRLRPARVALPHGTKAVSVTASYNYSMALTSTGSVLAWGYNGSGQLGNGFLTASEVPARVKLPAKVKVKMLASGGYDGLALTESGHVMSWGDDGFGQLGNGNARTSVLPVSVRLPKGVKITAVAGGSQHGLALTSSGGVLAWGRNTWGQLGNGKTARASVTPVRVRIPKGDKVVAISAGGGFSLAVTASGQVLAWGHNAWGQLGNGTKKDSHVPVVVKLPAGLTAVGLAKGPTTRHSVSIVK